MVAQLISRDDVDWHILTPQIRSTWIRTLSPWTGASRRSHIPSWWICWHYIHLSIWSNIGPGCDLSKGSSGSRSDRGRRKHPSWFKIKSHSRRIFRSMISMSFPRPAPVLVKRLGAKITQESSSCWLGWLEPSQSLLLASQRTKNEERGLMQAPH